MYIGNSMSLFKPKPKFSARSLSPPSQQTIRNGVSKGITDTVELTKEVLTDRIRRNKVENNPGHSDVIAFMKKEAEAWKNIAESSSSPSQPLKAMTESQPKEVRQTRYSLRDSLKR